MTHILEDIKADQPAIGRAIVKKVTSAHKQSIIDFMLMSFKVNDQLDILRMEKCPRCVASGGPIKGISKRFNSFCSPSFSPSCILCLALNNIKLPTFPPQWPVGVPHGKWRCGLCQDRRRGH